MHCSGVGRLVEGTYFAAALFIILPSDPISLREPTYEFVPGDAEGDGKRAGDKESDVRLEIASIGCSKKVHQKWRIPLHPKDVDYQEGNE